MKRILFILAMTTIMVSSISTTLAKENLPPPNDNKFSQKLHDPRQDWAKLLKLDDAQKAQFDAIQSASRPQIEAIRQQIATLQQQIDNIRADDEKKLQAILTENQQIKFDKIKARIAKRHKRPQSREERKKRFKMGEM